MTTDIGKTSSLGATGGVTMTAGLDADTLMTYCASQLNDLNSDINSGLAQQQKMAKVKSELGNLKTDLGQTGTNYSRSDVEKILTDFATTLKDMPEGPDRANLQGQFDAFRTQVCYQGGPSEKPNATYLDQGPGADPGFSNGVTYDANNFDKIAPDQRKVTDFKTMTTALDTVSTNLSGNAELDMMSLQELVSKRQTAIQTTTQIMSKFAQGIDSITNNIK